MPAGTLIAGFPVVLKIPVNAAERRRRAPWSRAGVVSTQPSSGTQIGIVGVSNRSYALEERRHLAARRARAAGARAITSVPGRRTPAVVEHAGERLEVVVAQAAAQDREAGVDRGR